MTMSEASMKTAFIGVGQMGHGIVKNLLLKGFDVTALEHPGNQSLEDLLELGLKTERTLYDAVHDANVVFLCVPGSPEVEELMYPHGGVLESVQPETIIVDCSTSEPASTADVAKTAGERGCYFIDAPMTRTPKEAEEGRLNVMLGGEDFVIDEILPMFEAYAEHIYRCGPPGSGHTMKLLHNFVSLGNAVVLAEAVAAVGKSGVDTEKFLNVIESGGGDSVVLQRLLPYIREGDDGGFRFSIANATKDMSYYVAMAEGLKTPTPIARGTRDVYEQARDAGIGGETVPRIIDLLQRKGL